MIIYNSIVSLKPQLQENIQELENYKNLYNRKIIEYNQGNDYIKSLLEKNYGQMTDVLSKNSKEKIKVFNMQISEINRNIEVLKNLLENIDSLNKDGIRKSINKYNKKYNEIKRNIAMNNLTFEVNTVVNDEQKQSTVVQEGSIQNNITKEEIKDIDNIENSMDNSTNKTEIEGIENNDTLIISEILGMVVLPYTAREVYEILDDKHNNYQTVEDVIFDKFTRPLSDYKFQAWSRYNETIKLLTKRQGYKLTDSISLALEMMGKRYLYPAIISACRNLDELDVYLDCLEKNEVDDFKIFKIKYELHPILVKQEKTKNRIFNPFKNTSVCKH